MYYIIYNIYIHILYINFTSMRVNLYIGIHIYRARLKGFADAHNCACIREISRS
jgi:hypothetical protein